MTIKNLKIYIDDYIYYNTSLYIFTAKYKKECEQREAIAKNKHIFALKSDDFDLDAAIKRLKKNNFNSNFHM